MSNRIAHFDFGRGFDTGDDIAYISGGDSFCRLHIEFENSNLIGVIFFACIEETNSIAGVHRSVYDFVVGDNSAERIENGVKDETLQRRIGIALRRRNTFNYCIKDFGHAVTSFGRATENLFTLAAE